MSKNKGIKHTYSAYGLEIRSSLPLPELIASAGAKEDITIREEALTSLVSKEIFSDQPYSITETQAFIHFSEVGTFSIENGCEIIIRPLPKIEERLVRLPLLGACLAVLLYQRGKFVLHASAIAVNGEAIVFVGNKGDGKSTMAAMLCSRGHQLLADDTVALELDMTNHPLVLPGFPLFKLYPDSVIAATNDDPDKLPEIASNVNKRSKQAGNFCEKVLPLRAIYVFDEGKDIQINKMLPQEAVRLLIAHSYMARFNADWLENGIAISNLRHCTRVAGQIPVYTLQRPRDLSNLKDVAVKVEQHLNNKS
jgi:hypothetical protein